MRFSIWYLSVVVIAGISVGGSGIATTHAAPTDPTAGALTLEPAPLLTMLPLPAAWGASARWEDNEVRRRTTTEAARAAADLLTGHFKNATPTILSTGVVEAAPTVHAPPAPRFLPDDPAPSAATASGNAAAVCALTADHSAGAFATGWTNGSTPGRATDRLEPDAPTWASRISPASPEVPFVANVAAPGVSLVAEAGSFPVNAADPTPNFLNYGAYTKVADSTMNAPGQSTVFTGFGGSSPLGSGAPAISGSNVAFAGTYSGGNGIYTVIPGAAGAARIADTSTNAPGQSTVFTSFRAPAINGSSVAFTGFYNGGSGIYTGVAGTTSATRIADTSTLVPGRSTAFTSFGALAISGSNLAFGGSFGSSGQGIFLFRGGSLLDVAETGEPLFGSTISTLNFGNTGLDGDSLTFAYTLANGLSGVATYAVPEPATWLGGALLLGGTALTLRHRVRGA